MTWLNRFTAALAERAAGIAEPFTDTRRNRDIKLWRVALIATANEHLYAQQRPLRRQLPAWLPHYLPSSHVEDLLTRVDDPFTLAVLATLHPSGEIRKVGVQWLAKDDSPTSLRWLLLRAVDWAPIQRLARESLLRRAQNAHEGDLAALVDACALLARAIAREEPYDDGWVQRQGAEPSLEPLVELITVSPGRELLLQVAKGNAQRAATAALQFLLPRESPRKLLALVHPQDSYRLHLLASAGLEESADCMAMARELFDTQEPRAQASGLWHLVTNHPQDAPPFVQRGLASRGSLARSIAQRHQHDQGIDVAQWYREQIADDPVVGFRGLADVGTAVDAAPAVAYVRDQPRDVRRMAARLIAKKGDRSHIPLLIDLVVNGTSDVRREATAGLVRHGISREVGIDLLDRLLVQDEEIALQRFLRQVYPYASRWVAAELALRAADSRHQRVRHQALERLDHTLARGDGHLQPATEAQPVLAELTLKHLERITAASLAEIRRVLR